MARLMDHLARPSAWLGVAGALLLLGAIGWSLGTRLLPAPTSACPQLRSAGQAAGMRILDIGSAELTLDGNVCLAIDNVVGAGVLRERDAPVAAARAVLLQAEQALVAVETPPRKVPSWERRYGVVQRAPATEEQRASARAVRDAAAVRLAAATKASDAGVTDRRIALFLNGERAPVAPRPVRGQSAPQTVIFALATDGGGADAAGFWRRLTDRPGEGGIVPVTVGIAEEGASRPAATLRVTPASNGGTSGPIGLRVYRPDMMWLAGIGTLLLLIGLIGTARGTALLRDGRSRYARYSLARVQMAGWFAITMAGFVYVWLVTGQYRDIVGSATFVLIGIAGATAGAARMVDGPRARAEPLSRGFVADIGGGERIELHRLQMIAWTIVLGGIYVWNVLANLRLTNFDPNLLALAGVVNGVYVALKTQEA